MVGGIFGFSALMLFAKFINEQNELISIYNLTPVFYLGAISFAFAMIFGLLGAISAIEADPAKSKKKQTEKVLKEEVKTKKKKKVKELEPTESNTDELTRDEKIELIKSIIAKDKETSIAWLESTTLIPEDEIIEIAVNELDMIVEGGSVLTQKEAKKRLSKK